MPRTIRSLAILAFVLRPACGLAESQNATPERRAVAFLAAEVPKWHRENRCYSCHNNGDAARALVAAARMGLLADRTPLADTLRFLATPKLWDDNGPNGPFKDKNLARIQFAAALADAAGTGMVADRAALESAATLVAETQTSEGHWESGEGGTVGSPATYGRTLASFMAMRMLSTVDPEKHRAALDQARRWFETTEPKSVLDAAATMWALARAGNRAAESQRKLSLELIRRGQSADGGWGPFVNSPPEVFDTAIVVLALKSQHDPCAFASMIAAGRKFLLEHQAGDGSWPPTTRPPGADSYAQRLSTSAWATLALLATRAKE
jgi:hypothetical protein